MSRNFLSLIFICTFALCLGAQSPQPDSIQGKAYANRINGVYDPSITDNQIEAFLQKAKQAIKTDNIKDVGKIFSFPFRCNFCITPQIIKSKREFARRYKEILTPSIKAAILKAELDKLFVNYQGVMIANGEIWFDPTRGIIALNDSTQRGTMQAH